MTPEQVAEAPARPALLFEDIAPPEEYGERMGTALRNYEEKKQSLVSVFETQKRMNAWLINLTRELSEMQTLEAVSLQRAFDGNLKKLDLPRDQLGPVESLVRRGNASYAHLVEKRIPAVSWELTESVVNILESRADFLEALLRRLSGRITAQAAQLQSEQQCEIQLGKHSVYSEILRLKGEMQQTAGRLRQHVQECRTAGRMSCNPNEDVPLDFDFQKLFNFAWEK